MSSTKLLILDLDETLIYATERCLDRKPDFLVGEYFVYKRPYLDTFLQTCFDRFDVAVWTSSTSDYATEVVTEIFTAPQDLVFVWARDRCTRGFDPEFYEYYYRKTLKKVKRRKGYALESIIAVDDTPQKWYQSYSNLVRVQPFEGDESDNELLQLPIYLERLSMVENVRSIEKRGWRSKI